MNNDRVNDTVAKIYEKVLVVTNANQFQKLISKASYLEKRGEYQRAVNVFIKAAKLKPSKVSPRIAIARNLMSLANFTDALTWARRSLALEPNQVFANVQAGTCLRQLGRLHEALSYFESALETGKTSLAVSISIAEIRAFLGQHEAALSLFASLREANPGNLNLLLKYAKYLMSVGEDFEALDVLRAALQTDSHRPKLLVQLHRTYQVLGMFSDALQTAETFSDMPGQRQKGQLLVAETLIALERFSEASALLLELAVEADPAKPISVRIARQLNGLGLAKDALHLLDAVLEVRPQSLEALILRAGILSNAEKLTEARATIERALRIDPNSVSALIIWTKTFYSNGECYQTFARLEKAVAETGSDQLNLFLAWQYFRVRVFSRAEELFKAQQGMPEQLTDAQIGLALIDLRNGKPISNTTELKDVLTQRKPSARVLSVLRARGQNEPEIRRFLKLHLSPELYGRLKFNNDCRPTWPKPKPAKADVVDVVYTWVDSSDPEWRTRFVEVSGLEPEMAESSNQNHRRYTNFGEIQFSLMMLERNFPQVRNIFVVTDNQRFALPPLSKEFAEKVQFVDHTEIIPADLVTLPTFNSDVIECFLHRIPGLSETSLYLNDDIFLGRPIETKELFNEEGVPFAMVSESFYSPKLAYKNRSLMACWPEDALLGPRKEATRRMFENVLGCQAPHVQSAHLGNLLVRSHEQKMLEVFKEALSETLFGAQLRLSTSPQYLALSTLYALHTGCMVPADAQRTRAESLFLSNDLDPRNVDELIESPKKFVCINVNDHRIEEYKRLQDHYLGTKGS